MSAEAKGYFLYHSIGLYPEKAADMTSEMTGFATHWAAPNDGQWRYALERRQRFIDLWAGIYNAPAGTVATCESVTSGLHAFLTGLPEGYLRGKRVLVAGDCFPSLHFLLTGLAPRLGFALDTVPLRDGASWVEDEDVIARWDRDVGFALLTWVTSTASARCDLDRLVAHGRDMNSLIGVDITQAAGLLPFDVMAPAVDFAISTSLKWMCGAPGAGAYYVARSLIGEMAPELRGWFSQGNPFSWDLDAFDFAPDARRFDSGSPGIVSAVASVPALEWHARQDKAALADHNRRLSDQIIDAADRAGLHLASPRDPARRGGSVMIRLGSPAQAEAVVAALRAEGLSTDHRGAVWRMSAGNVTEAGEIDRLFDVAARVCAGQAA